MSTLVDKKFVTFIGKKQILTHYHGAEVQPESRSAGAGRIHCNYNHPQTTLRGVAVERSYASKLNEITMFDRNLPKQSKTQ